jgi:hypothetical protein
VIPKGGLNAPYTEEPWQLTLCTYVIVGEFRVGGESMKKILWKAPFGIFASVALIFFIGCMGANYGSIIPDAAVTKAFESFRIDPDMNYYYSGPDAYPNALIGVKKSYVLDSDLWKPIEAQPNVFNELIMAMQSRALERGMSQYGFIIIGNKGQAIGVWYSILRATTVVRMGDDNKVVIYTPDLILFKEDRGGMVDQRGR